MKRGLHDPDGVRATDEGPAAHPRAPLGIGVTGHRPERLAAFDAGALTIAIETTLAALQSAAPPGTTFRLISNLAEGADAMVADGAIALGWVLDAVLPFARAEYALDFTSDAPRAALDAHLAHARSVFELAGARDERGGSATAYERAGRVMLTQSDLLFAVWDGDPPRGRGGAAQIVVEAVAQGIPVICIDPSGKTAPALLWSGLDDHDFGLETVTTIAHGGLADVPRLFAALTADIAPVATRPSRLAAFIRPVFASAYPLLLAVTGVRGLRRSDPFAPRHHGAPATPPSDGDRPATFADRIAMHLNPDFLRADGDASRVSQLFRSAYVTNFSLAALAVLLSLAGLALSPSIKPILVTAEFLAIATILIVTRVGSKARWHARWLESRRFAERLRCLAVSARFGDLALQTGSGARDVARTLGVPSTVVDAAFLRDGHRALMALLDDQIGYLDREAGRMHRLEHRLHRAGGLLFAATATLCLLFLVIESIGAMVPDLFGEPSHAMLIGGTIFSAALPTIGAAIYGIRMQGDFAGVAERDAALATDLRHLRLLGADETADFDMLRRLARRTTELLTLDVSQWLRAYQARPLALPG